MVDQHPAKQSLPMLYSDSSSSSILDQKSADKGSCPRTLFHLFDWNCHSHHGRRFFGHKSNYFGKTTLDPTNKTCIDEGLSCPLVAHDENRCVFSPANKCSIENYLPKDQTPEKKKKKPPNVVAKLMGLETMPSPEACRRRRQPLDSRSPNLMRTPDKTVNYPYTRVLSMKQRNHEVDTTAQSCSIRLESSKKNLLPDFSCKLGNENGTADKQHNQTEMQSSGNDVVISSQTQERVNNKLLSTARSAQAAFNSDGIQRNIREDKIIEGKPSEAKGLNIASFSLPANTHAGFKMERGKESISAETSHPAVKARADKNKAGAVGSASTSNVSSKKEEIGQASKHFKHAKNEKCQVDCRSGHEHIGCKADVRVEQRIMKTEQTGKRRSLTAGVKQQGTKLRKSQAKMVSYPLKVNLGRPHSKRNLSADSTAYSVQQTAPSCSTKSISRHKRLSSHSKGTNVEDGNKLKLQKTGKGEIVSSGLRFLGVDRGIVETSAEVVPRCGNNLYAKPAQRSYQHVLTGCNKATTEDYIDDVNDEQNHSVHCDLEEDMCSTDKAPLTNMQEKSETFGSSITFENGTLEIKQHDGDVQGSSEGSCISCTFQDRGFNEAERNTLDMLDIAKSTRQSIGESSLEDVGDTASSHERKSQRQTVSYSGKSTATILKELLLALNPLTKEFITDRVCTYEDNRCTLEVNDIQSARGLNSTSIDYMEDSVWNNSAAANVCEEENHHVYTHKGKLPVKGCTNYCRQLKSNLACVFPSENESMAAPESFSSIQESAACENVNSKRLITTFHPGGSGSLMSSRQLNSWNEAMQSEESYIQFVVRSAELTPAKIISARLLCSGPLIAAWLFEELESSCSLSRWQWGIQHEHDEDIQSCSSDDEFAGFSHATAGKTNRKLVFDCIEEALRHYMGIMEQESMQTSLPVIDPPSYNLCSEHVHKQIGDWRGMACGLNVDDMVEREMNSGLGKWHAFSSEKYQISVEIELSIFRDLIDELVPDLGTAIPSAPMKLNYKLQGLLKTKKEKYFWVGL